MHGNNIKFAVVSTVVVDVTLLTLGRLVIPNFVLPVLAQIPSGSTAASAEPITISDSNVKAEVVFKGIDFSTSMFFGSR
jgi:hypothetical protein